MKQILFHDILSWGLRIRLLRHLRSENKIIQVNLSINELNKIISYTNQWFALYASYVLTVMEDTKHLTDTTRFTGHTKAIKQ